MDNHKALLVKICILLIIILILRFIYIRLYSNNSLTLISKHNNINNIEHFGVNDGDSIDLLSKIKNNDIIKIDITNTNNLSNTIIKPWTTKIYNMQTGNQQIKPLAIYQPKLLINNVQYCKLGDMLCQNTDYSPPNSSHFALLIKKSSSDFRPPVKYDLIVNFGDENVNTNYYDYESYITTASSQADIYDILPNIINCSKIFTNINSLIQNNLDILETNLANQISSNVNISVGTKSYSILGVINSNNGINIPILPGDVFTLPAGMSGMFTAHQFNQVNQDTKILNNTTPITIPFNVPASLDSLQTNDKKKIASYVPGTLFNNIDNTNIIIENYSFLLYQLLPITSIINILQSLCNDINVIYNKHINNIKFLTYLNLVNNIQNVNILMNNITTLNTFLSPYDNINNITVFTNPEIIPYITPILNMDFGNSFLLGSVLNILNIMKINYNLNYIKTTITNSIKIPGYDINGNKESFTNNPITNNIIEHFVWYDSIPNAIGGTHYDTEGDRPGIHTIEAINNLTITSFKNNFISNLPKNTLNLNLNPTYSNIIRQSTNNIIEFTNFLNDLTNNTVKNLPLKIYKPIPPPGYLSLGHIFCNIQTQLADITLNDVSGNGVCCIPENCVKEVREWNMSDKMFEYNKDNIYWALYYNPYTGTFISTNTNSLPDGKLCKVVACVKKCTAIDDLKKADDCIRNYYNMNKSYSVKLAPDLVSNAEEEYYLQKVQTQSDTITKLYKKANTMQLDIDKANIVNSEMNKNKLQTYVDKQKRNIDIVTKRLEDDGNSIQTNVNMPLDVLNKILSIIQNHKQLSQKQKTELVSKLINNKTMATSNLITKGEYEQNINKILSSCPEYDLSGLVKKDVVSNVCYGCST